MNHLTSAFDALRTAPPAPVEHSRLAARIRESVLPLFETVGPIPYRELQRMLDKTHPWGLRCYQNALYLDELSDAAIATITEQMRGKSSPLSSVNIFHHNANITPAQTPH
ncbi:MAG: hypothetical protein ACRDRI_00695 [Pseudonocardiaceae bacterium]